MLCKGYKLPWCHEIGRNNLFCEKGLDLTDEKNFTYTHNNSYTCNTFFN